MKDINTLFKVAARGGAVLKDAEASVLRIDVSVVAPVPIYLALYLQESDNRNPTD